MRVLNKIHKKQCIAQSLLEKSHNLCLPVYILVCFIPADDFIIDILQHHAATKGTAPGLFKAKTKNTRV